jgi:hypothetical protein
MTATAAASRARTEAVVEQLVVLVIFVLLSLLGGALKKKPHEEEGAPLPAPDGEDATFRPAPQRRAPPADDDPFAGWGVWPDQEQEQEEETEEVLVGWDDPVPPTRREPERPAPVAAHAPVPLPTPVTVRPPESRAWQQGMQVAPAPVVRSLEREVDRAAEHRRFHDIIDEERRPEVQEPARNVLAGLRKPATLREAVLLAEVIGPPRAVRPFGNLPLG